MAEVKLVCRRCFGYGIIHGELGHGQRTCPDCHLSGTPADGPGVPDGGPGVDPVSSTSPVPGPPSPTSDAPADPVASGDGTGIVLPATGPGPSPFYLTFGVNYARVVHPQGEWIHPDGWVTVVAPSYAEARRVVYGLFGRNWCDLYASDRFAADLYPRGELLRVVVPAGVIEGEDHRV